MISMPTLRLCTQCVYPETKPGLTFNAQGVCSACSNFQDRTDTEWGARQKELVQVLERYRAKPGHGYDCIIPASGGKDSMVQVLKVLELGFHPLIVCVVPEQITEVGRRNLETMKNFGVDTLEVTLNPRVQRAVARITLRELGDIMWHENYSIYTVPVTIAARLGIKLLIWGENPAHEYGGPATVADGPALSREWFMEMGGLHNRTLEDFVGQEGIRLEDTVLYRYPSDEELARVGVTGLFLGYYYPWDGLQNFVIAQAHGFESHPVQVEGSLYGFEHIDSYLVGLHDYFKYLKFGFGRTSDVACNLIRRGRLTRAEGLKLVEEHDGKFPWTYLGRPLERILGDLGLTVDEFVSICDQWTSRTAFEWIGDQPVKDRNGRLKRINVTA